MSAVGSLNLLALPDRSRLSYSALFTLVFFCWYFFTSIFTQSEGFWIRKVLGVLSSVLIYCFVLLFFKNSKQFEIVETCLLAIGIGTSTYVWFFYLTGDLEYLLRQGYDKENSGLPGYLVIGSASAIATIILMLRPSVMSILIAGFTFLPLLAIGARGPTVFCILCILISYAFLFREYVTTNTKLLKSVLVVITFFLVLTYMLDLQVSQLLTQRLGAIFTDENILAATGRLDVFEKTLVIISENFFLGTGIGSYGALAYGSDTNIYPHNLFLEAWAESGLIGLLLFTISCLMTFRCALRSIDDRSGLIWFSLLLFVSLNFLKSGGFIWTRDLYFMAGVAIAYSTLRSREQASVKSG
ncbi:O-antigen ligase family protein [Pseudomonadales bacterium]|nr:O-antigen ligase family protein [Pseudomonadales bacterium]